jgi:hypothetical protein
MINIFQGECMSNNKDRIIKTLSKYSLEADEIDWQPLGAALEMCGPSGGWYVHLTNCKDYMALNIESLINEIETYEGHHTDPKLIQKYCNHIPIYINQYDHSEGCKCCRCGVYLDIVT